MMMTIFHMIQESKKSNHIAKLVVVLLLIIWVGTKIRDLNLLKTRIIDILDKIPIKCHQRHLMLIIIMMLIQVDFWIIAT